MTLKQLWDKLDVIVVLGFLIAVETQITNGSMSFAHTLPESWIPAVKEWAANLASIGGLLVGVLRMAGNGGQGQIGAGVKSAIIVALAIGGLVAFTGDARAQTKPRIPLPIDPLHLNDGGTASSSGVKLTGDPAFDLVRMLDAKLLPDLTYAKGLADANGNKLTSGCWSAWIDLINTNENAVKNADGSPQDPPDPHLITTLERAIDIRNALQPSAPFMVACSPVANLIKTDVLNFIGQVIGGGLSLTKLVPLL